MKEILFLFFSCIRIAEHFDKGSFKYFILFFYQAKFLAGFGKFLLEGDDLNVLCSSDNHIKHIWQVLTWTMSAERQLQIFSFLLPGKVSRGFRPVPAWGRWLQPHAQERAVFIGRSWFTMSFTEEAFRYLEIRSEAKAREASEKLRTLWTSKDYLMQEMHPLKQALEHAEVMKVTFAANRRTCQ